MRPSNHTLYWLVDYVYNQREEFRELDFPSTSKVERELTHLIHWLESFIDYDEELRVGDRPDTI